MRVQEQKVVGKVQELFESLSTAGKAEVLNHLVDQLEAKNLDRLSDKARYLVLQAMPSVRNRSEDTAIEPSWEIAPHRRCHLDVRATEIGSDVSFIIPRGVSGRQIVEAVEKANPRGPGNGVVWPESLVLQDGSLDRVARSDIHVSVTVCFAFNNLDRNEQRERLAENHLRFSHRWAVVLAAALYRDACKFPRRQSDIGTPRDTGDLFKGLWIRAGLGVLSSGRRGIGDNGLWGDLRRTDVIAAGSPVSNQNS